MTATETDFIEALGWQGGTIHQAIDEVKQLRKIEDHLVQVLAARIFNGYGSICRCCGNRICSEYCISNMLTDEAKDKLRHMRRSIKD